MQPLRLRERLRLRRDWLAGALLALATAAVIVWQDAHVCVLWDFSYVLDTAARIALGQTPYREFPLAHAPMPFLIQAALIKLFGRVYWHTTVYCAAAGAASSLLTWRIVLHTVRNWTSAFLLALPLAVVGVYCILPHPSYDCDTGLSVLLALYLLQRVIEGRMRSWGGCFLAGAALTASVFFKQNIGLPLLAVGGVFLLLLLGKSLSHPRRDTTAPRMGHPNLVHLNTPRMERPHSAKPLCAVLAGAAAMLVVGLAAIECWAGLGNYFHWTIAFARTRRMPGLATMLDVYRQPWLWWMLPCTAAGFWLTKFERVWSRATGLALMAAPFLWTLLTPLIYDNADERTDALLAIWPFVLLLAAALLLARLVRGEWTRALLPLLALTAVHGTLMSQQLWGSTYAIWPLLVVLLAELLTVAVKGRWMPAALSAVLAAALLVCGGLYTASEERLSYVDLPEGPVEHSAFAAMRGASTGGKYLADFDELLRFAKAQIPVQDGLILLPGEDPFYYATGRTPRFPVLLFDPATDPYTAAQLAAEARARGVRWLVVKRRMQMKDDPTPEREEAQRRLTREFRLAARLGAYDVYAR